jgi:histidinol-phosphate/aromatic aminotransferase/cobyric acid decarboxylase-like protein/ubiquinone/menaquinone biosynthesis C-methylase UbiE
MPWYLDYFTEDYWAYADAEYTRERTEVEVGYLAAVLAGCRRVLDLGCGTGRHAIGLALRGFEVTGVDVSEYALARAARSAAEAGVELQLRRADLLSRTGWEVPPVDAVICVQAFGWGQDTDQLRMLRNVRRLLPPGGLLVLDHSSIHAIAGAYRSRDRAVAGSATFTFNRRYDPVSGRSAGQVDIARADGTAATLPDDVRLYTPAEVRSLLSSAGFDIIAADADFRAGNPVTVAARYVQFVAVARAPVRSALAGHQGRPPEDAVDLRTASDEAEFSAAAVTAAWPAAGAAGAAAIARRYDLDDPYGGLRSAPVLAAQLGWPRGDQPGHARITVGAGVSGLLHGLSSMARGGIVLADQDGHPQLTESAAASGAQVEIRPFTGVTSVAEAIAELRPALIVIDRPALTGPRWPALAIAELAEHAARAGSVLIVDETCACYLPPGDSTAPLTDTARAMIVLRGVSKGYCCGGLRIGFAIASPDLAAEARESLAPLAGSALSLELALGLLRQPDPLASLRTRIAEVKPRVEAAARDAGMTITRTDEHVPWIAMEDDLATRSALATGLIVKETRPGLLRMAVPLSPGRYDAVMARLGGPCGFRPSDDSFRRARH